MMSEHLKNIAKAAGQIVLLTAIGLLGTAISNFLNIPIPGSLLGMFILFGLLMSGLIKIEWVELGAALLIGDLLLFFIPSATGIIQYTDLFGVTGALLVVVVITSIVIVLASIVASTVWVTGLKRRGYKLW